MMYRHDPYNHDPYNPTIPRPAAADDEDKKKVKMTANNAAL